VVASTVNVPFVSAARDALRLTRYEPPVDKGQAVEAVARVDLTCPKAPVGVPGGVVGGIPGGLARDRWRRRHLRPHLHPAFVGQASTRIRVDSNGGSGESDQEGQPGYPELAKQSHVSGNRTPGGDHRKDGTVVQLRATGGPPLLVQPALDAVKQWTYKPTLLNGEPVEVETAIDVNFTLAQ